MKNKKNFMDRKEKMKLKEYTNIQDYIKIKKEEKKQILKGTVICKAKKCDNFLYKNQSSCDPRYCSHCF